MAAKLWARRRVVGENQRGGQGEMMVGLQDGGKKFESSCECGGHEN